MTTDYSKMDHQTLYNYAHSGNPDQMNATALAWQSHSQALDDATSELQTNLTAIQSQWQGAAADAYFQQSQAVATKMQTQADNAANTSTAVTNTASALTWARGNMPDPPSWLEQQAANIDSNVVTGALGFITTGGAANAASELAKHDIADKHQQAISTMTQLASAYTSAQGQLPSTAGSNYKDPENGDGNGNGNGNGTGTAPVMPVPVYPIGTTSGGGGGGGGYSGGSGTGNGGGSGSYGGGTGGAGGGTASGKVPAYSDPGGTTFTQGAADGTGTTGGYGSSTDPYSSPTDGAAGGYGAGGAGELGGVGAGGLGAGAGALGGGFGAGGYGSGKYGVGKGGTSLGSGEGTGIGSEKSTAAKFGAAGEGKGVEGGAQGQQGMMGGAGGRGGAGGQGEERGTRAGFLRQDPDYWYGDKQAAPPGGVIE
jgi:uncharacterized protein YukE